MHIYKIVFILLFNSMAHAQILKIAHAGGGYNGQNYTNSLEALDYNYAQGFKYFEMDFSWTTDQQLVCLHDWKKRFKKVFSYKTDTILSLTEFKELLKNTTGVHPCTLDTFAQWVKKHPDIKIITDVKYDNIKAIKKIITKYPNIKRQIIPQFYQPHEYQLLKDLGFKNLIWILYQYKGSNKSVYDHAMKMNLMALSMRAPQVKNKHMQALIKQGKQLFVYTINKDKKLQNLIEKYHISGVYTDFLDSENL